MKVIEKKTKKKYKVYDVLFRISDYGKHTDGEEILFLVYQDGEWVYQDAEKFEPAEEALGEENGK